MGRRVCWICSLTLAALVVSVTPAPAQDAVWSAVLTPKSGTGTSVGCFDSASTFKCSNTSVLTDNDFTLTSDYTIKDLYIDGDATLFLVLSRDYDSATDQLTLEVDGTSTFALSGGVDAPGVTGSKSWPNSGLSWAVDDTVQLRLFEPVIRLVTAPGAPTGLSATASGSSTINLSWTAPSSDGGSAITGYKIESSTDGGANYTDLVADTGGTATTYAHTGLTAGTTRHYEVSAINLVGTGEASIAASATTQGSPSGGGGGGGGGGGSGGGSEPEPDPEPEPEPEPEPDPGPLKASFDVGVGVDCSDDLCRALTGAAVRFVDTSTGAVARREWSFGDGRRARSAIANRAWAEPGFYEVTLTVVDGDGESTKSRTFLVEASTRAGTCVADAHTRCLNDSRYAVTVDWRPAGAGSRKGSVIRAGTNDSGLFHFFNAANWEVLIKVLDACTLNGNVWVFAASTTDVGYTIRVTDTVTGAVKEYGNEPGMPAAAITDSRAFPESCRPQ